MAGWVYMLATRKDGVLYVGTTNDLVRRVHEHRAHAAPGFTSTYNVDKLVWFECHETMPLAIEREKRLKSWRRAWKIRLIEAENPDWRDLWPDILR